MEINIAEQIAEKIEKECKKKRAWEWCCDKNCIVCQCGILLSLGLIKTEKVEECKEIKSMTTKN